jgi:hypothetical protein
MVNRVASPSGRTPAAAPKTQAPKARVAQQAGQTAAAGWGADAKAPTSLKITSAKIDEGVATLPKIAVPKGYSVAVKDLSSKASDTVHGKKVGIEQTDQQVTLTGPNGKKMTVGSGGDMPGTLSEWKSEVKGAKAGPENEYLQLNWDSNHTTSGVGTAAGVAMNPPARKAPIATIATTNPPTINTKRWRSLASSTGFGSRVGFDAPGCGLPGATAIGTVAVAVSVDEKRASSRSMPLVSSDSAGGGVTTGATGATGSATVVAGRSTVSRASVGG